MFHVPSAAFPIILLIQEDTLVLQWQLMPLPGIMIPSTYTEGGLMILRHESTLELADQDASVVPGGAAYWHDRERRLAPSCERTEPRPRAMAARRGLLSPVERPNSWPVAEVSGDATPYAVQPVRRRALWDPAAGREELRRYLIQPLGEPEAVLVLDEPGVLKQGRHSAGVARQ